MSNDVANNKALGQPDSVTEHASKVFEKSSVCSVSKILSTENKPRRIIWSVVFGLFTVAFLYQFFAFLHYVLQSPTIVDYESLRPGFHVSPAYTFCNNNLLKRSKFCEKYPRNCTKPDRQFCFENPRFCGTPNTQVLKYDSFDIDNRREFYEFSHDVEDMIDFDEDDWDKPVGPLPRVNTNENTITACFSVFGRVDSPLEPFMNVKTPFAIGTRKVFRFYPEENELMYPEAKSGIVFDLHSPFEASNPFETGVFMRPGYLYRIRVKMTQEELMPYDCTNYTELWLKNGKTGYRSQAACKYKCIGDVSVKCFNCHEPFILYPYPNETLCTRGQLEFIDECKNMEDRIIECINGCKDDCLKLSYSYEVQENFQNLYAHEVERNESRSIKVFVEFRDTDIRKIVHKPQFLALEVFSLIGGLLAFWIGLSMFQIIEVFDSIFQITRNILKKRSSRLESSSA